MLRKFSFLLVFVIPSAGIAATGDIPDELTAAQLAAHPEIRGALDAIDAWIEGVYHYEEVPGISAGIVMDQQLLWNRGYGYSNLSTKRPADADTIYSICSISKLFTSIGIMQLRDAGKLRLSDPVADYLDWYDIRQAYEGSAPVTIESLLTHSSGLPRESDHNYWNGPDFPFPTREEIIERFHGQETLYPARKYFQYSNLALTLAGEIVQEVSGQDYAQYVAEQILGPLGLRDTRTFYPDELRGRQLAIGYNGVDRRHSRAETKPFHTRGITAAAGFTSTVNDLARFASWQFRVLESGGDAVLDANTLREMQRVHWVDPDWETTWGIGFNVHRVDDLTVVGHGGGCPGYITRFDMLPKQKLAAIVLTNAGDGPAYRMVENMLKTMSEALKAATEVSDEELPDFSKYEGNYDFPPWGGEVAIRQSGDELLLIDIPSDDLTEAINRLQHVEGDTFVRLDDEDEPREPWVFEIGANGVATRVTRHNFTMTRIE